MLSSRLVEASRPYRGEFVAEILDHFFFHSASRIFADIFDHVVLRKNREWEWGRGMGNGEMGKAKAVTYLTLPLLLPDRLFCARSGLRPDERAYTPACHRAFDVARLVISKTRIGNRYLAERDRGGVHHRELFLQDFMFSVVYLDCVRVFSGVGCEDAADAGRLHNDVGLNLQRAHRRRRVGGEERLSDAGGENDNAAFSMWRMARRRMKGSAISRISIATTRVKTSSFSSASCSATAFITVASMPIGGGAVHARRARPQPAEDVSADDQRDFDAQVNMHLFDFLGYADNHLGIDPISDLFR